MGVGGDGWGVGRFYIKPNKHSIFFLTWHVNGNRNAHVCRNDAAAVDKLESCLNVLEAALTEFSALTQAVICEFKQILPSFNFLKHV